jgi:Tfp pilus assembly protein PilN
MINLLPHELKQEYRYARKNRKLLKWVGAFAVAILGVGVIAGVGVFMMNDSSEEYKAKIATAQAELASQNQAAVQKEVKEISNNLKLMVTVLSKEILFSKLLTQLGTITPANVILTDLSISQTESAIDITAHTANYEAATQLQVNMTDPKHPCTATIRAQFTENNPFLFINATNAKAGS